MIRTFLYKRLLQASWFILMIFGLGKDGRGQIVAEPRTDIAVYDNSTALQHAWAGGLNAPQFSEIDLDMDGKKDLFVFDREGNRILTFINNGSPGTIDYTFSPSYAANFPKLYYWALLVDYNNDGKEDIFTSSQEGVQVYKNTSTQATGISFQLVSAPYLLSYEDAINQVKISVTSQDIPAIADIDSDGDIDILTFGNTSTAVEYHENLAADSGDLEIFRFRINTHCWGKFEESPVSNKVTLHQNCPKTGKANKHAGGTLLAFDADGDLDMELLLGDMFYTNMIFLTNGGDRFIADMSAQDTSFPSNSTGIRLQSFPGAYLADVDNDGLKDLLVAPNVQNNMEDKTGVLLYKNTGTSSLMQFVYQTNDFLQGEMADMGTGAYPVFFDYNFDGRTDMLVGNYGKYNGPLTAIASLHLYEQTGTASDPKFSLVDSDFGGLSVLPLNVGLNLTTLNIVPTLGDLNGDGDADMIVGDYEGKVHYFVNKAANAKSIFELEQAEFENIDVGRYASPQLFDLDRDGLLDLIIGEYDGNLNYYRNSGTIQKPEFTFVTDSLGKFTTSEFMNYPGYSQPYFFRTQNEILLICGMESGQLRLYKDIQDNLANAFTLVDSALFNIDAGRRSHVAVNDLDGDGFFELIVGNYAGGLSLYSTDREIGIGERVSQGNGDFEFYLSQPDPNSVHLRFPAAYQNLSAELSIRSSHGQMIRRTVFSGNILLDLSDFSNGMYLFSVQSSHGYRTQKLILCR